MAHTEQWRVYNDHIKLSASLNTSEQKVQWGEVNSIIKVYFFGEGSKKTQAPKASPQY